MWVSNRRVRRLALVLTVLLCAALPGRASQLIDPEKIVADEVRYKTDTAAQGELIRSVSGSGSR